MLRVAMGGRAAEEIVYDEFTTGAAGDLQMATNQAHSMVCEYGMSDLGPVAFTGGKEIFLGRDFSKERDFSEETAARIDSEIRNMLERAYNDAKGLLTKHRNVLDAVTDALVERETLDGKELDDIIIKVGGRDILPVKEEPQPPSKPSATVTPEKPRRVVEDDKPSGIDPVPPGDIVPGTA
jgi:cell division protease FtsH